MKHLKITDFEIFIIYIHNLPVRICSFYFKLLLCFYEPGDISET